MKHSLLSTIRDLRLRRGRERRGLALAEGVRLVEEALAAGIRLHGAAVSPSLEATPRGEALKAALTRAAVPLLVLEEAALEELSDTEHPQGVVAVIEPPGWSLADFRRDELSAVLVLDAVQDPGNVGTLIRTAHGLGATGVLALPGTAELGNPKVLRAGMGSQFRLPAVPTDDAGFFSWLEETGTSLWVADAGGRPVRDSRPVRPFALAVGNEGAGVRPALEAVARGRLAVPLAGSAESLNVAVAAGILLYEVLHGH